MADPISSSLAPNDSLACQIDPDAPATCEAPPSVPSEAPPLSCTAEALASNAPPAGTPGLVARFSPPAALPKPIVGSGLPVVSHSSLSTSSGAVAGGSYRVAATGFKAQVETGPLKGSSLELATGYVQYGKDKDAQVALARRTMALSGHGYGVTLTGDTGVARAHLGEHNDDGSLGGNIGAGVELVGAEVTVDTPVGSATYGLSASMDLGGSMGVRDADHDGKLEYCAKFSIPAYTVGACVEEFW